MDNLLLKIIRTLALSLPLVLPFTAFGSEIQVISSDESMFRFVVSFDPTELDHALDADSLSTFFTTVQIGLPAGAQPRLVSATGLSRADFDFDRAGVTGLSAVVHSLAVLAEPITIRGRRLAALRIYPVSGTMAWDKIDVTVRFVGATAVVHPAAPDPHFARIFRKVVANYDQFSTWPAEEPPAAKSAVTVGPFASGQDWYKLAVNRTGLCRVSGAQLASAGLSLNNLNSNTLHLYNGGGAPLPVDNTQPRPTFDEVAITVVDGGDGRFDSNDYIQFYAESVDRWRYTNLGSLYYQHDAYERNNVYWLTVVAADGLRMATDDVTPGGAVDTTIISFRRSVRVEQDNLLRQYNDGAIFDYFVWFWTNESTLLFSSTAPGIMSDSIATIDLFGQTYSPYMSLRTNGLLEESYDRGPFRSSFYSGKLIEGLNNFEVTQWGTNDIKPYFNYAVLNYPSFLSPEHNVLDYAGPMVNADAHLTLVDRFSGTFVALNITDPLRPTVMTGAQRSGSLVQLDVTLSATARQHYYFTTENALTAPVSIRKVTPVDLYAADQQADMIVVTTAALAPALNEYLTYRRGQGYSIRVVDVSDVMDNFSFGMYDPTAIRDYLKYAYENYPAPAPYAVLLVGDGTYDYLDYLGTGVVNLIPPYLMSGDQSASDDNYVFFGRYGVLDGDTSYFAPDRGYDMLIARWPIRTAAEINTIVAKVKQYESPANLGAWRANVTLVADDERAGNSNSETVHVIQTELLEKEHIPSDLSRDKIYLWDYPLVNREKPAVNDAAVHAINDGTLLINYVGHGNPDVWAHEHVFSRDGDLPRLTNAERLPLFFAASCAISFFDDPSRDGMAEDLLVMPTGGAIATIAASRLVYSNENALFNRKVYDILLYSDSLSIAEAVFAAKLQRQYSAGPIPFPISNDRAYLFFGDPLVQLGLPRLSIQFDNPPESLMALGQTHVSGSVRDRSGALYAADGELVVTVYDSDREKTFRLFNSGDTVIQTVDYSLTGPTIFRGTATVTGGQFGFDFISPIDIGYGGRGARIQVYARFDDNDGLGAIDSLAIAVDIANHADSTGPTVTYRFPDNPDFTDGGALTPDVSLEIELSDSSGINLTGGLGHGITLIIDDQTDKMVDLTSLFAYDQDDFTTGRLDYPLRGLTPGRHTFKIKAWDNANNSSIMEFAAEVQAAGGLAILDLLNYPNPMQESTRFSYRLTQPAERLSLDIFTLSGRKIQSFSRFPSVPGYYDDIVWNGDDYAGDRVATGVYIYKATAVTADGGTVESYGKVVVIN